MKSKIKKYVHKCLNLSRVDDFAHLESLIFRIEHIGHLRMTSGTRWPSQNLQKMSKIVSRVHGQSCPRIQKTKKRGHLHSFQARRAKESKSTCVYQARSLCGRLRERDRATYAPAPSPGRSHTRAPSFQIQSLRAPWGSLAQVLGVVGLSTAPPPFPRFTYSAEALPKFAQPPVATRVSDEARERVRERERDVSKSTSNGLFRVGCITARQSLP